MGYLLRGVVGAAMLAVMAPAIPWLYVVRARVQRTNAITDQLPDVLVLISNGLKAGHGFLQAAELVAQEMDPPIGEEFEKFLRETSLGSTTEKALNSLNERCDNDDLDLAITAVLIQRQIGGNLAEILDRILHTIRERIRIKQEIRTLTAQGRMSAIIITLLPPAVGIIIYFLSPEFMTLLLTTKIGIGMLVGAAVSELIGALIIRNIVDIEV
jgi:tight adherence protein B